MWKFLVNKVNFQAAGRATRDTIGLLTPAHSKPTFTFELNRPGQASVTVEHFELQPEVRTAIQNLLEMNSNARMLELVVMNPQNKIFWSGPFIGMNRRSQNATELLFKDDLYWLQRLILNREVDTSRQFQRHLVTNMVAAEAFLGYVDEDDATQNLNTYLDFGLDTLYADGMDRWVQPSTEGENAIDPRQGKTVLEWLQFLAERDPSYSFHFEMRRPGSPTDDMDMHFHAEGRDRSADFVLLDSEVMDQVNVASSWAVKDLCNVVYAVGEGAGETPLGTDGRVWYYSSPALLPTDDPLYKDTRPLIGTVFAPVVSPGLLEGGLDDANEPDGSSPTTDEITSSVENYADAVAFSRTLPLIVPSGYKKGFEADSDSPIVNEPYYLLPGDTLQLFQETGFLRGEAQKATISKLSYTIHGGLVELGIEFK